MEPSFLIEKYSLIIAYALWKRSACCLGETERRAHRLWQAAFT
jgi:hypothetical protein